MVLSIIIPTYNREKILEQTLASAGEAVKHLAAEIIVVNDVKGNELKMPSCPVPIILTRSKKPGVAAKRNLGAHLAKAELLLFLDDDILISKSTIDHIIKLHAVDENICVNLNWIYPPRLTTKLTDSSFGRFMIAHNLVSFKGWYNHSSWRDNELFQSPSVASFHLSISKNNFSKTGGYNESFIEAGFEDYDFPVRLKKIGIKFFIDTRMLVFHNEEDRVTLDSWLIRQQRGAYTRKEAVMLGYDELKLHYGVFKVIAFFVIALLRNTLLVLIGGFSKRTFLDPLSFRLILLLQAQSIYRGYSHKVLQK